MRESWNISSFPTDPAIILRLGPAAGRQAASLAETVLQRI